MISARSTYRRVVDQQRAALAAGEVLRLVETLRRHAAEGAEILPLIFPEEAVRIVLNDRDAVAVGDRHDGVHLAADARVMHGHDRLACAA